MGTADPWPDEQGFLAGGPGRAAEVTVVSLVEAGAVRISRDGTVSAVHGPPRSWTPLQACALRSLPRPLGPLISTVARSPEAFSLRHSLVERGFVRSPGQRSAVRWLRRLGFLGALALVVAAIADAVPGGAAFAAVLGALVLVAVTAPLVRPLTGSGRAVVRRMRVAAVTGDPVRLVAFYGLLGRVGRKEVWRVLGIDAAAAATLRRRRRADGSTGSASCGSGCGSCGSSSCGGSSSDSGSSSSSSDSGGSSCGGGGGGCGGGGGD